MLAALRPRVQDDAVAAEDPETTRGEAWSRRDLLAFMGLGLLAGFGWLTLVGCGAGLLLGIVPGYLAVQRRTLLHGRAERGRPLLVWPWLLVIVGCAGLGLASSWGFAVVLRLTDSATTSLGRDLARALGGLLSAGLFGALTAPLLTLPLALMDPERSRSLREAMLTSSELVAARPVRALGEGALHAMVFAAPVLLTITLHHYLLLVVGAVTTPALAYAVARAYRTRAPAPSPTAGALTLQPRLRVMLAFVALPALAVVVALAIMAARPAPTRPMPVPGSHAEARGYWPSSDLPSWLEPLPTRLPGTSITLRPQVRGLRVTTEDGGGAGSIPTPYGFTVRAAGVPPEDLAALRDGRQVGVYLDAGGGVYAICLDARGVRCDDSTLARLSANVPWPTWFVLLLAVLFFVRFLWRNLPDLLMRSRLRDVRVSGDHRGLRALSGTLRWGEGASVSPGSGVGPRARAVEIEGEVKLDAGDFVVRLPPGFTRALADRRHADEFRDGAKLTLVGAFAQMVAGGFREATIDLPDGHWLVPGDMKAAEARLATKTTLEALVSLALAACALVVAALILGLGLLGLGG